MEFNELDPIGHEDDYRPKKPFRNHRLRRGIYILPSIFTVANLLCGYYAILATLEGSIKDLDNAAAAIGIAILFDSLDGRVARAMGTNSEFGKEFDSLADVVSFGMAPAFLAYAWGVHGMAAAGSAPELHLVQLGWLVGFFSSVAARGDWPGSIFMAWRPAEAAISWGCRRLPLREWSRPQSTHFPIRFRTPKFQCCGCWRFLCSVC